MMACALECAESVVASHQFYYTYLMKDCPDTTTRTYDANFGPSPGGCFGCQQTYCLTIGDAERSHHDMDYYLKVGGLRGFPDETTIEKPLTFMKNHEIELDVRDQLGTRLYYARYIQIKHNTNTNLLAEVGYQIESPSGATYTATQTLREDFLATVRINDTASPVQGEVRVLLHKDNKP